MRQQERFVGPAPRGEGQRLRMRSGSVIALFVFNVSIIIVLVEITRALQHSDVIINIMTRSCDLLRDLHWLAVHDRIAFKSLCVLRLIDLTNRRIYPMLYNNMFLCVICALRLSDCCRTFRSDEYRQGSVLSCCTTYLERTDLYMSSFIVIFKCSLKSHLFRQNTV